MDAVAQLKKKIKELEKSLSLRQVAIRSGINYITLRNIKFGKSSRVTDSVMQRLEKFHSSFDPAKPQDIVPAKRGRKKGSKNKVKKTVALKTTPKAAKKSPGRPRGKAVAKKSDDTVLSAIQMEISSLETRLSSLRRIRDDYKSSMG
jgi:hypothetical protein